MTYDLLEEIEQPFIDEVNQIKCDIKNNKELFLQFDFPEKKSKDYFPIFLYNISEFYSALCFSDDLDIQAKFIKLGVPKPKLKWIIPLADILYEIKEIEKSRNIILVKKAVILLIQKHLKYKIKNEIFCWGNLIARNKMKFDLKKYYFKLFRRIKDGNGRLKRYKNKFEVILEKEIIEIEALFKKKGDVRNYILSLIIGKTEKEYLTQIIESCYYNINDVSKRQFLGKMFGLYRLICKDRKLLSEELFNEWMEKLRIQKSTTRPYDGDYNEYKYKRLKKLIYKK